MSRHLERCDTCGKLMFPGSPEHIAHACAAPKPAPAAGPQTDENRCKHGVYNIDCYECYPTQQSASSAQGEEEAPLNKDAIFASSTFARPYLDGSCQQTPFDVAKHSYYCGYIEGMRIGAEREKEKATGDLMAYSTETADYKERCATLEAQIAELREQLRGAIK